MFSTSGAGGATGAWRHSVGRCATGANFSVDLVTAQTVYYSTARGRRDVFPLDRVVRILKETLNDKRQCAQFVDSTEEAMVAFFVAPQD